MAESTLQTRLIKAIYAMSGHRARSLHPCITTMPRRRARISTPLQCQDASLETRVPASPQCQNVRLETRVPDHGNAKTKGSKPASSKARSPHLVKPEAGIQHHFNG